MKLSDKPKIPLPADMDTLCIGLCDLLNRLPDTETYESCMGHFQHPYWICFRCTNIDVLSRLGRCVERNYSDGNWEILVASCDDHPRGCFWLRMTVILPPKKLCESIEGLENNILHWFKDEFDKYFDK